MSPSASISVNGSDVNVPNSANTSSIKSPLLNHKNMKSPARKNKWRNESDVINQQNKGKVLEK